MGRKLLILWIWDCPFEQDSPPQNTSNFFKKNYATSLLSTHQKWYLPNITRKYRQFPRISYIFTTQSMRLSNFLEEIVMRKLDWSYLIRISSGYLLLKWGLDILSSIFSITVQPHYFSQNKRFCNSFLHFMKSHRFATSCKNCIALCVRYHIF